MTTESEFLLRLGLGLHDASDRCDDRSLGCDHLQLSKRTYNRVIEENCMTIGHALVAWDRGLLTPNSLGAKGSDETGKALAAFTKCRDDSGSVNWPLFWELRPPVEHRLAIASQSLRRLAADEAASTIGILHLKKACTPLESAGITTLGLLIQAAESGIENLKSFGKRAHTETVLALTALHRCIDGEGAVDWEQFAVERNFPLLPGQDDPAGNGKALLDYLPQFCEQVGAAQFDDRERQIFKLRWLACDDDRQTLAEIGIGYGLTRERIRQISDVVISAIRRPVFENDYRGLTFRLKRELSETLIAAKEHFQSLGLSSGRESVWLTELATFWGVPGATIDRHKRLLMALLSHETIRPD